MIHIHSTQVLETISYACEKIPSNLVYVSGYMNEIDSISDCQHIRKNAETKQYPKANTDWQRIIIPFLYSILIYPNTYSH